MPGAFVPHALAPLCPTTTLVEAWPEFPQPSAYTTVTVKVPAVVNVWLRVGPIPAGAFGLSLVNQVKPGVVVQPPGAVTLKLSGTPGEPELGPLITGVTVAASAGCAGTAPLAETSTSSGSNHVARRSNRGHARGAPRSAGRSAVTRRIVHSSSRRATPAPYHIHNNSAPPDPSTVPRRPAASGHERGRLAIIANDGRTNRGRR